MTVSALCEWISQLVLHRQPSEGASCTRYDSLTDCQKKVKTLQRTLPICEKKPFVSLSSRSSDASSTTAAGAGSASPADPEAPLLPGVTSAPGGCTKRRLSLCSIAAVKRGSAPAARRFLSVSDRLASFRLLESTQTAAATSAALVAKASNCDWLASRRRLPRLVCGARVAWLTSGGRSPSTPAGPTSGHTKSTTALSLKRYKTILHQHIPLEKPVAQAGVLLL